MSTTSNSTAARPAPVSLAVKLVYATAVVSVLGAVAVLADRDGLRQQALTAAGGDAAVADTAVTVAVAAGIAGAVVGAALWLVFGVLAGRGRNWARIVVTVLAALTIISALTSLAGPALLVVVAVVRLVLAVAVVVLLFRPEANRWYAGLRAARQAHLAGAAPTT